MKLTYWITSTEGLMKAFFKSSIVYFLLIFHVYLKKKSLLSKLHVPDKRRKTHKLFLWRASEKRQRLRGVFWLIDNWFDWCLLWLPVAIIIALVLSDAGQHHHLSSLPFLYVSTLLFPSLLAPLSIPMSNLQWLLPSPSHENVILKQ